MNSELRRAVSDILGEDSLVLLQHRFRECVNQNAELARRNIDRLTSALVLCVKTHVYLKRQRHGALQRQLQARCSCTQHVQVAVCGSWNPVGLAGSACTAANAAKDGDAAPMYTVSASLARLEQQSEQQLHQRRFATSSSQPAFNVVQGSVCSVNSQRGLSVVNVSRSESDGPTVVSATWLAERAPAQAVSDGSASAVSYCRCGLSTT